MDIWFYVLSPFTWLLELFYNFFGSYGFALITFALVVKLILFPLSLKGKKGMIQMNMLSGKMQQIQKKYANDKERQNQEIQNLYAKEKVNPMSGCLWSMLPIFVLLPLYAIIRQPLKYMMGLDGTQINTLVEVLNTFVANPINTTGDAYFQLSAASALFHNFGAVTASPAVAAFVDHLKQLDFTFIGMNLATVPSYKIWLGPFDWNTIGTFIIPLVSAGTGLLFSLISMKTNSMNTQANAQQNSTNKMMMLMTPLISLWIGYSMPAALSIYWVANNVLSMLQELVASKLLKKDYEKAAELRAEQERLEKEEEKKKRHEAAERKARAMAEGKSKKGKKPEKKQKDTAVIGVSSVGVRAYARGRAYDPYRFSEDGPTPYREPGAPIDEDALEKALEKKSDRLEQEALAEAADEMIVEEIMEEKRAAAGEDLPETDEAPLTEDADPWAAIDQEVAEFQEEAESLETEDPEAPKE